MKRIFSKTHILFFSCLLLVNAAYSGGTYVHVNDMSLVDYQMVSNGKVYFRNLNEFNSSVTGCCYAFYIDTSTDYGKSTWSTMLMKMATKQDLYLYVDESNPPTGGNAALISHIGNW